MNAMKQNDQQILIFNIRIGSMRKNFSAGCNTRFTSIDTNNLIVVAIECNKNVLLRDRKRHAASAKPVWREGVPPALSGEGGTSCPVLEKGRGYPCPVWGVPCPVWGYPKMDPGLPPDRTRSTPPPPFPWAWTRGQPSHSVVLWVMFQCIMGRAPAPLLTDRHL